MKLSRFAIKKILPYVLGDSMPYYRKGSALVDLFNKYGARDVYDFQNGGLPDIGKANKQRPSRKEYVEVRLMDISGKQVLGDLLEEVLSADELDEVEIKAISHILELEGFHVRREGNMVQIVAGQAIIQPPKNSGVEPAQTKPASVKHTAPAESTNSITVKPITVFISYSWDGKQHQDWVLALADRLQANGVRVLLDQYVLRVGDELTHFMEQSIQQADKVLLIMTPNYKLKADGRTGGVGYEYSMITTKYLRDHPAPNFIPVARSGSLAECSPTFIASRLALDMTDDSRFETDLETLLRHIYDQHYVVAPALGPKPTFSTRQPATAPTATPPFAPQAKKNNGLIGLQNMSLIGFAKSIIKQKTPIGDLARDMQGDYEFPTDESYEEILSYLRFKTSRQGNGPVAESFAKAYLAYHAKHPVIEERILEEVIFNTEKWKQILKHFSCDKVVLVGKLQEDIYKAYPIDSKAGNALAFHLGSRLSNLNKIQTIPADGVPDGHLSTLMDPATALLTLSACPYIYDKPNQVLFDGLLQLLSRSAQ